VLDFILIGDQYGGTDQKPEFICLFYKLMLRCKLNSDRFSTVSLTRRFYLIAFITPESELLAFNSLCRLGWSFSGNPAWVAEILRLAAWSTPLPCQNQGEIHCRVRIAYLSGLVVYRKALNRYAMRTLRRLRGFKCWV
jgi:hypothetical protein